VRRRSFLSAALLGLLSSLVAVGWTLGCASSPWPPGRSRDGSGGRPAPAPTVILISFDGFRWDYLQHTETPNLDRLIARGVHAEGLIPVFPSSTFPSHYSMVTGLYPGHHGIFANDMRDRVLGAEFHLGDREAVADSRWWGGEPIWIGAERAGMRTAAMFWPGSEGVIAGHRPTYWHTFDKGFAFERRVAQVLEWLDLPSGERPQFITLYFEQPNDSGHRFGPDAVETLEAVRRVDGQLGDLVAGLERRGLADRVDLIVVSDHGMAAIAPERTVYLDDYVRFEEGELFDQGSLVQIFPLPGREDPIYAALDGADPHLAVYRRAEIPLRYHLDGSPRTPPIFGIPDAGWEAITHDTFAAWGANLKGDHGQDPGSEDLHGLFVAAGPSFRRGLEIGRFENVQIYNLLAAVLRIEPAPNDGDPDFPKALLAQ
jgi:predicted AlkP superfamily pyrophosphatase or phosphodiesterase